MDNLKSDIVIVPQGQTDVAFLTDLGELHSSLIQSDIKAHASTLSATGIKDALIIGISIAGLVLTSISMVISILAYWQSTKTKYSVSITTKDATYEISNLNKKEILKMSESLQKQPSNAPLIVRIGRK